MTRPSPPAVAAGPLTVLARMRAGRPPSTSGERCEMCGEAIADAHSHVVNVSSRSLLCTCRACYLLFLAENAQLAYRSVPERYLSFPSFRLTPLQWDDLQIPVGIAFFFRNTPMDRTVAFYPSPAGATESELPLGAWDGIVAANPELGTLAPDVEAILVRAVEGTRRYECFLVPIDACYELVGHLRTLWRGFDGGQDVRRKLDELFAGITAKARPATSPAEVAGP